MAIPHRTELTVKIVSEMMGHTRTAITQDLYTHVSAAMQRNAADALDRVIAEAPALSRAATSEPQSRLTLPFD